MDYLDYSNLKKIKIPIYPNNDLIDRSKIRFTESNSYSQYLNPETKQKIKSIYSQNNNRLHEIVYKNKEYPIKENQKMIKFLAEKYSFPFKNYKTKKIIKNTNINNNDIKVEKQYSFNPNLKSKDYTNYSPKNGQMPNYQEKNNYLVENKNEPNIMQTYLNNNYKKYQINQNNNIKKYSQCEKALLLNKLNSSKSTSNFYGEDILIEYNNVPILDQKQNYNKGYTGNYSNDRTNYMIKKKNFLNNNNNCSYESYNNNSLIENNNYIKYIYIRNNINKKNNSGNINNNTSCKSHLDTELNNYEENLDSRDTSQNGDYLSKYKNWQFYRQKNYYQNTTMKNIKDNINAHNNIYNARDHSFEKYETNNNIFDINDNNYNTNISNAKIREKMDKIQKNNLEIFNRENQIKHNLDNYKITYINRAINTNNNEVEKNDNSNEKKIKNYKNKSKKDIFQNKEYENTIKLGNQNYKKRKSPELKNKKHSNPYLLNAIKPKTSKNIINNKNKIFYENYDSKEINNKRNINNQNNFDKNNLLTEKNINNKKLYDYLIKDSKNISYIKCNTNINSYMIKQNQYRNDKITDLSSLPTYLNKKNNTSRYDNSHLETQNYVLYTNDSPIIRFSNNICGNKSSKNISIFKKDINQFPKKEKAGVSPSSNINLTMKNIKNIKLEENNNKENINGYNDMNLKTENNIQYNNKNGRNKIDINNRNKNSKNSNSFSLLKSINQNNINNNPVKLYLKKKDIKNNKDIIKQYKNMKENNNTNKNNRNETVENIINNNSNINNNIINSKNKNNNIININNTTSNVNILNVKKSSINICIDNKNKLNVIYQNKNINPANINIKTNSILNKKNDNDKLNVKLMRNELSQKSKCFKNIIFTTSQTINRNINDSNSIMISYPSYIRIPTNENKNKNVNFETENNNKSYKNINIIYKDNNIDNTRNFKKLILYNSTQFLHSKNSLDNESFNSKNVNNKINYKFFRDVWISEKNDLKNNNDSKNSFENNFRNTRNSNLSNGNIKLYRPKKSPTLDNNLKIFKFKDSINSPKISNTTKIDSKNLISNTNNSFGVYTKPKGITSKSRSKPKKIKKANYNSQRNTNTRKIIDKNQSNFNIFFKTSPIFYQKDDYFQSEFGTIKKGSTSLNSSHLTKYENSSFKAKENDILLENNNNAIINFIREPFKKGYFFVHKIYKYSIKIPGIELCHFSKKNINKINDLDLLDKKENKDKNNLRVTFGRNDRNKNQFSFENKNEITNIEDFNYNDIEESDLDIYKELQKKMQNGSEEKSNNDKLFFINKEVLIHETIQKLKALNKDYNKINNIEIEENNINEQNTNSKNDNNNNDLKYKNLENGIKILNNLALRKGLKCEPLNNFFIEKNDQKKEIICKSELNKINYYVNFEKNEGRNKCSKSLNKDIIKGISKIQNILRKNIISNESEEKIKISKNENIFDYNREQEQRIRTYIPGNKSNKNEFCKGNDNSLVNSYYEESSLNNNIVENQIQTNYNEQKQDKKDNDNNNVDRQLKYSEEMINFNDSISMGDNSENKNNSKDKNNISQNNSDGSQDFDNYLKIIKKNKSNNILKQDFIFLLNIITQGNYSFVLKQLTQIILYQISKSKDQNTSITKKLKDNNDIIHNEHLFISIIFKQIENGIKYVNIYSKLCSDLNLNILNGLIEQKNMKNNKERNLKLIINDECIKIINNFKQDEIDIIKDINNKDYKLSFFKQKLTGFVNFVYELINVEILKQQFGLYTLEQLYKLFNKDNKENYQNDSFANIYLEGIIALIFKLGKLFFKKDNQKLLININNYIKNNLVPLIDVQNIKNNLTSYLFYRIMNLISKADNQWKEPVIDLFEEEEQEIIQENKSNLSKNYTDNLTKIKNLSERNFSDINKTLIEEDIINYISYFSEETNKGKINIKSYVDKSYNWKIIDELVNNKKFGLESIINYYISICSSFDYDDNKIILSNDYIKNIIEFYANNLPKKAIESIQNEMIKTFSNIDNIVEQNKEMYKILGNLLFVLIDNKLFQIKFFNNYLKVDKKTQINLAIITKYCIISSKKFAKKYLNDFKQTKLFINNDIFEKYVIENLKDLLYFIN